MDLVEAVRDQLETHTEATLELAQVHDILGGLGERDDLGLARGQGDALLLARAPQASAAPCHCTTQPDVEAAVAQEASAWPWGGAPPWALPSARW